jgi:dolichol-phosphate mannosyltransferase
MSDSSLLSILVPFHNEARTLETVVRRLLDLSGRIGPFEIVLVDDGSTDESPAIGRRLARLHPELVKLEQVPVRRGKGFAVRAGLQRASGDWLLVQDADGEYDPADIPSLVGALRSGKSPIVYGSRLLGPDRRGYLAYYWGGRLLSFLTNGLFRSSLTDGCTGYKAFTREVARGLELERDGFDFCSEFTAKALKSGHQIFELPIRYAPRSFRMGKKLRAKDGLAFARTLLWVRFLWAPKRAGAGP